MLEQGVEIRFMTMVQDLIVRGWKRQKAWVDSKTVKAFTLREDRGGRRQGRIRLVCDICKKHGIETRNGTVDVGVRVEVRDEIMKELNEKLYEAKLVYYTPTFDDKVRVFCTNPSGEVATEYYDDGLAESRTCYKSRDMKTNNTNFALLVSKNFNRTLPLAY